MDIAALCNANASLKVLRPETKATLVQSEEARSRPEHRRRIAEREVLREKCAPAQVGSRQSTSSSACTTAHRAGEHTVSSRVRRDDADRRGCLRASRHNLGAVPRADHPSPERCLPALLGCNRAGMRPNMSRPAACRPRRLSQGRPLEAWRPCALCRQAEIHAWQGTKLDLGAWTGRACFHLQPIADDRGQHLVVVDRMFMDETTAPVLDPGQRRTKKLPIQARGRAGHVRHRRAGRCCPGVRRLGRSRLRRGHCQLDPVWELVEKLM